MKKCLAILQVTFAIALPALAAPDQSKPVYVDTEPDPAASFPADPDRSRAMVLAWDKWHKLVATEIYNRFDKNARIQFEGSPALEAQISYMVASDGRIGNVRILKPSENGYYNTMLVTTIKSMAHNPVLEYPAGSKRKFVEKSGTFTWNKKQWHDLPPAPMPQIGPKMLAK